MTVAGVGDVAVSGAGADRGMRWSVSSWVLTECGESAGGHLGRCGRHVGELLVGTIGLVITGQLFGKGGTGAGAVSGEDGGEWS